jgi:hypothetical protein
MSRNIANCIDSRVILDVEASVVAGIGMLQMHIKRRELFAEMNAGVAQKIAKKRLELCATLLVGGAVNLKFTALHVTSH